MSNENWYGKDLDHGAMATDHRPLKERFFSWLEKLLNQESIIDTTANQEEGQTQESPREI